MMYEKNILFILSGQVFRINKFSEDEMVKRQIVTALSHINLIKYIKKKFNLDVKILFNIQKTKYNDILYNIYKEYILEKNEYIKAESEFELIEKTLDYLKKYLNSKFEYIFFLRADIYLKNYFVNNFKINENKVIYTHIDGNFKSFCFNRFPSIWQCINLFPKKFFYLLNKKDKIWFYHEGANNLIYKLNNYDIIDLFDYNIYYTTSEIDWNPMYIMNDRPYINNIREKNLRVKINKLINNFIAPLNKKLEEIKYWEKINLIEFFEIDNNTIKEIKSKEEDFNKLVNDLNVKKYLI